MKTELLLTLLLFTFSINTEAEENSIDKVLKAGKLPGRIEYALTDSAMPNQPNWQSKLLESLSPIKNEQGLCGYQDEENNWIIPAEFEHCSEFFQSIAIVELHGLKGVIDRTGAWLSQKPKLLSYFGTLWQKRQSEAGSLIGVIDTNGQWAIPPVLPINNMNYKIESDGLYTCDSDRHCNRYRFNIDEPPAEVDLPKELLNIPVAQLQNTEAPYPKAENDLWGFVDEQDKWVVKPTFTKVGLFSEGLASVSNDGNLWGYIDSTGTMVIQPQYTKIQDFHQSVAWVYIDAWALIDKTGKQLTSRAFDEIADFESDSTIANNDGQAFIVNTTGSTFVPAGKPTSHYFSSDLVPAQGDNNTCGYLNKKGRWVIPPIYVSTTSFSGGYATVTDTSWAPSADNTNAIQIQDILFSEDKSTLLIKFSNEGKSRSALLNPENGQWFIADEDVNPSLLKAIHYPTQSER